MQGIRIDKEQMKKIREEKELKPENQETKKKVPVGKIIFWTIIVLIGAAYMALLIGGRFIIPESNELYQSFDIFSKNNPNNYIRVASYVLFVIIVGSLLRGLFKLLRKSDKLTKKMSKAVLDLIGNLVKWVMIIVIVCLVLTLFGIDTTAILAGLGIAALIIGLALTSLIEDIVAGFFIIAEKTFDVGDIVVIDGFRGTVISIGIRSTKIADIGNNVLTLRNASIGSLINLTDRQSCAAVTFPLAPGESIEKVEAVMKQADLDKIAHEKYPFVKFAMYLGTCGINKWGVQELLFIAGCDETKIYESERFLYREVSVIFEKAGIKVGGPVIEADE
ncbi:MAG: mechanosensitive ion channel [Clostridia bacterium]|nr:mechanosensitive ion channel [Clostridia bacterium]